MKNVLNFGSVFFAIGLVGIGVEHFIYQDFIIGRAPGWPELVPGKVVWAYLSGTMVLLVSLSLFLKKRARIFLVALAALIFLWAFLRHIPIVISDSLLSGAWTSAGKALVFMGGAFAVASTFPKELFRNKPILSRLVNADREFTIAGRICLGIFLVITGIQHFIFVEFVASLLPGWFPGDAVFWTYFAGVALVSGGLGLFIPPTASWAALLSGWMVFSWVWIVHVPRIMVSTSDNIAVFEALAFSGIAFVLSKRSGKAHS